MSRKADGPLLHRACAWVVRYRALVLGAILAVTAFFAWHAVQIPVKSEYIDLFPTEHAYVKLYQEFKDFGGAQTLVIMLHAPDGDVFQPRYLEALQKVQEQVDLLPGVNHNEIFSLASQRVTRVEAVGGGLRTVPYMFPDVPTTPAGVADLKEAVMEGPLRGSLVSYDGSAAVVRAGFQEQELDYGDLFARLQKIRHEAEAAGLNLHLAGEPVILGASYHYLPIITALFVVSLVLIFAVLYLVLYMNRLWWLPAITGIFSAFWGLGFAELMGWSLNPLVLVIPFLLGARDLSHGVQWLDRYQEVFEVRRDKHAAAVETLQVMHAPALMSIVTDAVGVFFLFISGIPLLTQMAFMSAFWLGSAMITVVTFLATAVPSLPEPSHGRPARMRQRILAWFEGPFNWSYRRLESDRFTRPVLAVAAGTFVAGFGMMFALDVGYSDVGTPIFRKNTQINRDIAAISKEFPTDLMTVIVSSNEREYVLRPEVLREVIDFERKLEETPGVVAATSFADIITSFNEVFHYQHPKFRNVPMYPLLARDLTQAYISGSAPGEFEQFIDYNQFNMIVRILLQDHRSQTLGRAVDAIKGFLDKHPNLAPSKPMEEGSPTFRFLYAAGPAGLMEASNESIWYVHNLNLFIVLGTIFAICAAIYRSLTAGFVLLLFSIVANFVIFVFMVPAGIGLTVNTLPVVSISIGMGINFAIYLLSRIKDEQSADHITTLEASRIAVRTTGRREFHVMLVMLASVVAWAFSPALFHAQMGLLLGLLMVSNTLASLLLIPAIVVYFEPGFLRR